MEGRETILDLKEMIGPRIQEIRNKKGVTQDQLSEKVGISSKYLSSIERGKENPTVNTIRCERSWTKCPFLLTDLMFPRSKNRYNNRYN